MEQVVNRLCITHATEEKLSQNSLQFAAKVTNKSLLSMLVAEVIELLFLFLFLLHGKEKKN